MNNLKQRKCLDMLVTLGISIILFLVFVTIALFGGLTLGDGIRIHGTHTEIILGTLTLFVLALAFFGLPKVQHKHRFLRYAKWMLYLTYFPPFLYFVCVSLYVLMFTDIGLNPKFYKAMAFNITAHLAAYCTVWLIERGWTWRR